MEYSNIVVKLDNQGHPLNDIERVIVVLLQIRDSLTKEVIH